jgi:GTPase SAR1 family protein
LDKLVETLPSLELTECIQKEPGVRDIGVIGQISCGKTTLINTFYETNHETALGNCTEKCNIAFGNQFLRVWDCPGSDDTFAFYNPLNLSFVRDLNLCVILFDNDIRSIENILKVVYSINKNILVIRTKIDQYRGGSRTVAEEKILDCHKLKNLGVTAPLLHISSHNFQDHGELFDWKELNNYMC